MDIIHIIQRQIQNWTGRTKDLDSHDFWLEYISWMNLMQFSWQAVIKISLLFRQEIELKWKQTCVSITVCRQVW